MPQRSGSVFLLLLLIVFARPLSASKPTSQGWNGKWKLDAAAGKKGADFAVSLLPNGQYAILLGKTGSQFACNGSPYPISTSETVTCRITKNAAMDRTYTKNGKVYSSSHWVLAADGNSIAYKRERTLDDGKKEKVSGTYLRVSAGTGFAGSWVNLDNQNDESSEMVLKLSKDTLQISLPLAKQHTDAKLDGTDSPTHGAKEGSGVTLSVTPQSLFQFHFVHKLNGVEEFEGTLTLSADQSTITNESWSPKNSAHRTRRVYVREH